MLNLDADSVAGALPYDKLISALDDAFRAGAQVPERMQLPVEVPESADGTLLLMPCWQSGGLLGVKIATVFPGNADAGLSAVYASYFLMDAVTGRPLAVLDGTQLTLRRTAAASALASTYLSRHDSKTLLMVGTGRLAPHLIRAHAAARKIDGVLIWGRRPEAAGRVAGELSRERFSVEVAGRLGEAVQKADIVSCATLATEPLIKGAWLSEGQHVDLVGAFKPDMREADGAALARARVYVDTYAGALSEAGDIVRALADGVIAESDIAGDLAELVRGQKSGRSSDKEITLFKSVGTALEDLAAAQLVMGGQDA
ncbi:MAG: ornithine cyclodeaminase family protein [Woeseia sp.]